MLLPSSPRGTVGIARKAQNENAAVLYIRVSTADQAEHGVSLDAQAERLTAYAKAAGLSVTAVLREEGVTGRPVSPGPERAP
jgi:predicted site-specific integrase-resolvase